MSEEILINVTPRETRVAVVENGMLQEVHIERAQRRGYVGNIYKGKVSRVMPGMQAAFVEIGLDRAAFLHASDIVRAAPSLVGDAAEGGGNSGPTPPILDLVREGHEVVVQVVKDPIGSKGARLTTHLSIPSRYLVLLPYSRMVGVSVRIEDETERARLKESLQQLGRDGSLGFIVRTNAEGQSFEALAEDVDYLGRLWQAVQEGISQARVGTRIYEDLPLSLRALRDLMRRDIEKVRVDSRETFDKIHSFTQQFMPDMVERIEHYPGERPIFDLYGVEDEIQRALRKEVPLKSGGYLIVDQTEAMTTVDVNTGAFLGHRNLEETVYRTNLEAAQAAARQLRLRNLGGIIIIDFIDMESVEHRNAVLDELRRATARDRTRITLNGFTTLGLVEMTRKRTRESLAHVLCQPCPTCAGRGEVRTPHTVCYDILREILREARAFNAREYRVIAAQPGIDLFLEDEASSLTMLSDFIGKPISVQVESGYSQEQFDIVLM
ncbi:MAG TPA: ribonuclease G [Tahibacter sp.]|nr:ribonuclease G [Tahibacter sp.]